MWGLPANADDYYQIAIKEIISSGTGVSPVQAQANVHGRRIGTLKQERPCRGGFKTRPYARTFTVSLRFQKKLPE
jgi:hypothetical protein